MEVEEDSAWLELSKEARQQTRNQKEKNQELQFLNIIRKLNNIHLHYDTNAYNFQTKQCFIS